METPPSQPTSTPGVRILIDLAHRLEAEGNVFGALTAYEQAFLLAGTGSGLGEEIALAIDELQRRSANTERIESVQTTQPMGQQESQVAAEACSESAAPRGQGSMKGGTPRMEAEEPREVMDRQRRGESREKRRGEEPSDIGIRARRRIEFLPRALVAGGVCALMALAALGWLVRGGWIGSPRRPTITPTAKATPARVLSPTLPPAAAVATSSTPTVTPSATATKAPAIVATAEVFAGRGWQETGVQLQAGDLVVVQYLSGLWTYGASGVPFHDAGGPPNRYVCTEWVPASSCCEPIPDFDKGALIGRLGQTLLKVSSRYKFTASAEGRLELRMHDCDDGLGDNQGSVVVRIIVWRP